MQGKMGQMDFKIEFSYHGSMSRHVGPVYTVCKLLTRPSDCEVEVDYVEYMGLAWCSLKDQPSRLVGRKIALKRALVNAKVKREDRRQVWTTIMDKGFRVK